MTFRTTVHGKLLSPLLISFAIWAIKLKNHNYLLSEIDLVKDDRCPDGVRPFDWTLDLVGSGDIRHVKELWLICPPHRRNPLGSTVCFPVSDPYQIFQFKVANMLGITENVRRTDHLVVGRVTDKETGACESAIWDSEKQEMLINYRSSIYNFGSWSHTVAPIGAISLPVMDLNLS